jgi:hypothetical protein
MQITDILAQVGGLGSIAKQLGIDEGQAAKGAAALAPAILGGFQKQAQAGGGIDGLGGLLGKLGGGGLLDQVLSQQPGNFDQGNAVLGQIFGSKDVSRAVAQKAASGSGLSPDLLKKMLPLLAMAVAGYMAKQKSGGGQVAAAGGPGGLLGGLLGGGAGSKASGLAAMLDRNGDGNPLDDILRSLGKG